MSHSFFLTSLCFGFLLAVQSAKNQQCLERSKTTCPVNQQSCNNTNAGACKIDNDCPCPELCCIVKCKRACVAPSAKNATTTSQHNGTSSTNATSKKNASQTAKIVPRSGGNQSTVNGKNQTKTDAKNETAHGAPKNETNWTSSVDAVNATTQDNGTNNETITSSQSAGIIPRSSSGSLLESTNNSTASGNKTATNGTTNEKPPEKDAKKPGNQTKAGNLNKAGKPLDEPIITPRSLSGKPTFPGSGGDDVDEFEALAKDSENAMSLGVGAAEEIAPKDQQLDEDDYSDPGDLAKKKAKARKPNKMPINSADIFKEPPTTKAPKPKPSKPDLLPEEKDAMKKLRSKMLRTQHAQGFEHTTDPDDEEDEELKNIRTEKAAKRTGTIEKEQQDLARRKLKEKRTSKQNFDKSDGKLEENLEQGRKLKEKRTSKPDFDKSDDKLEENVEQRRKLKEKRISNPDFDKSDDKLEENVEQRRNLKEKGVSNPDFDKSDDKLEENVEQGRKTRKNTRKERIEDTEIEESNRKAKRAKAQAKNPDYDDPEEINRKKGKSKQTEKNRDYDDQFTNSKKLDKDTDEIERAVDAMSAGKPNGWKMNAENNPERIRNPYQGGYFGGEDDGLGQRTRKLKPEEAFTEGDSLSKGNKKLKTQEKFLGSLTDLPELPSTGKTKPIRRKNLGATEYLKPEDSNKEPLDSEYDDLPKPIREPKKGRKLPFEEAPEIQTEPNIEGKSSPTSTETTLKPEMIDTADIPESSSSQKRRQPVVLGDSLAKPRKPARSTPSPTQPPAEDLVIKHRDLILQMLYKVPRLLQKSVYKGRTVPPMVVKLPNGEYIYAPPFPGYDAKPLEPEETEANKTENVRTAQQTPFTSPWSKFLLNSRPFGEKAPGNYPYPIIMVITKPGDIFNMFPEQGLPSFSQYYNQLKMPFYINKHFNKNNSMNEPEILNLSRSIE